MMIKLKNNNNYFKQNHNRIKNAYKTKDVQFDEYSNYFTVKKKYSSLVQNGLNIDL